MTKTTLEHAERVWLGRIYQAAAKKAVERTSGKTSSTTPRQDGKAVRNRG